MLRQLNIAVLAAAALMAPFALTAPVAAQGTIKGKVNFDGRMADPRPVRVSGDAFCVKAHQGDPLLRETYLFNKEKATLVNVIVYISSDVEGEAPEEAVEITQEGCQYKPHVVTATAGQTVKITNGDNTSHNLNLKAEKNQSFNESQPVQGMVKEVKFGKSELAMPLKCDVHSWMNAWIAVFDHPFHDVSDENGEFEITGVPAGTYKVSVWHEFDKFTPVEETIEVEVKDGETSEIAFTYQPPQ